MPSTIQHLPQQQCLGITNLQEVQALPAHHQRGRRGGACRHNLRTVHEEVLKPACPRSLQEAVQKGIADAEARERCRCPSRQSKEISGRPDETLRLLLIQEADIKARLDVRREASGHANNVWMILMTVTLNQIKRLMY